MSNKAIVLDANILILIECNFSGVSPKKSNFRLSGITAIRGIAATVCNGLSSCLSKPPAPLQSPDPVSRYCPTCLSRTSGSTSASSASFSSAVSGSSSAQRLATQPHSSRR